MLYSQEKYSLCLKQKDEKCFLSKSKKLSEGAWGMKGWHSEGDRRSVCIPSRLSCQRRKTSDLDGKLCFSRLTVLPKGVQVSPVSNMALCYVSKAKSARHEALNAQSQEYDGNDLLKYVYYEINFLYKTFNQIEGGHYTQVLNDLPVFYLLTPFSNV